jgi:feruloyl esterase
MNDLSRLRSPRAFVIFLCVLAGVLQLAISHAADGNGSATADQCAQITRADFSGLPEGPAQIISATTVTANDDVPEHCDIRAYAWRNIEIRVRVPLTGWNEKLLVLGSGGQSGTINDAFVSVAIPQQLHRGFAIVQHNSGHTSTVLDSKWAWNDESRMIDYGFRAGHVATAFGKAVVTRFKGQAPSKSYFAGCSNGGREAMMMAQRYPADFDGIVAGDPSQAYAELFVHMAWFKDRLSGKSFDITAAKSLHNAVLEQCDGLDGQRDGLLQDPRRCKVDFSRLRCSEGANQECLSEEQIATARTIYQGPRTSDGRQIGMPYVMPGSELTWHWWVDMVGNYPLEVLRYLAFSPALGPSFSFDVNKLEEYRERMGAMDALLSATDPDLRPFRDRGGKLLIYWGWSDALGGVTRGVDYFEAMQRVMGGAKPTAEFARMFMVPGMNHCSGGDGPWDIDYLSALDAWVSTGAPPESLRASHPATESSRGFSSLIPYYQSEKHVRR